jgi:2-oxoisovalerate dehydrogenase E2 component (dihydrolipoyl transacylase)
LSWCRLSNIGVVGGTYASPVVVPPQVAIAAIGRIQTLPRYDETGVLKPVKIVNFSFSADHRVVDGVTMAHYSNKLKSYLENPMQMLGDTV